MGSFAFWLTPGGEIEAGRRRCDAARRELREELGLTVEVAGPVYTEATQFEHHGEMRDNVDFVFTARCEAEGPALQGVTADEIELMKEIRWWTAEEIEASAERIFPVIGGADAGLEFFAEALEDDIADGGRKDGDGEIFKW